MTATRVQTPPVLVERHGQWYVEILLDGGQDVVQAPVGDGAFLLEQIVEKIVAPRLRAAARRPQKSDN